MNIGQLKVLSWLAAAVLTLGLSFYVYSFISGLPALQASPDGKRVKTILEEVEPLRTKTEDLVAYEDIIRLLLPSCEQCKRNDPNHRHLNWTGKEKVVERSGDTEAKPEVPAVVAVRDLIVISMIKVDLSDPKNSSVFLKYKPRAGVQAAATLGYLLHVDDALAPPHDKIRIEDIQADAVVFAFEDPAREKETLGPADFDARTQINEVGADGVVLPKIAVIPRSTAAPFRPGRTTAIGENKFVLGTEDMRTINDNFAQILGSEVRTGRHQDPKTGKYDGIEIKSVNPSSLAASHGAQEGDVIKSINGHPVTSLNEAITYVKNNADQYTTWEVVVESKGKLVTKIYHSPQE